MIYVGQQIEMPTVDELDAAWAPQPVPAAPGTLDAGVTDDQAAPDEVVPMLPGLPEMDPPEHTRMRRLVARPLSVNKLAEFEPEIRKEVDRAYDRLVAEVRAHGSVDFKDVLALPLTLQVNSLVMDIPPPDLSKLGRSAVDSLAVFSLDPAARRAAEAAYPPYARYFLNEYTPRAALKSATSGSPDLMRKLLEPDDEGQSLTPEEFAGHAAVLFRAGFETTTSLLVNGLRALLEHPDQFELLRSNHSLIPSAVEEMLRWDGPVLGLFRVTREDVTLHGRTIPAGAFVQLLFSSANRDETRFADPHAFRVDRNPKDHYAFGGFRHLCVGAELARMEARLAIEALLERTTDLRQVGPAPVSRHTVLRRRTAMPITLTPA